MQGKQDAVSNRLLGERECEGICEDVISFTRGGGDTTVYVWPWWSGEIRWARNDTNLSSERRGITISISRTLPGRPFVTASTNQIDRQSLEHMVKFCETVAQQTKSRIEDMPMPGPPMTLTGGTVWSDSTINTTAQSRGKLTTLLTASAVDTGMMSSGYVQMQAGEFARKSTGEKMTFEAITRAQCSMTVRHPKGRASGWAGASGYDWSVIDGERLAARALDKCLRSLDPVRIEPGRYTVVLEPQAVADVVVGLFPGALDRSDPELNGAGPFVSGFDRSLQIFMSKLGTKVVDERITISHDPADPLLGIAPSYSLKPITWIERGVLKSLHHSRIYALTKLNENEGGWFRDSFRMSGGTTTIDEMIETTKRGILVTRFSGMQTFDRNTLMATGLTRDGLWLIENGKISKPIQNLRLTESPLFVMNQIEQLGVPVPVFRPIRSFSAPGLTQVIVPALKSNDFSFTALIDAI